MNLILLKINAVRILFILLPAILLIVSCQKEETAQTGYDQELLDAVNAHRNSLGLAPLEHSDVIWQEAHNHSAAMADGSVPFGHDGLTQRSENITTFYGLGITAENIAWGSGSAAEIVNIWLESTGHKANIEGDFKLTGISAVKANDGNWYYTQIFYKSTK
jgi:uncharacterized protein YkwD